MGGLRLSIASVLPICQGPTHPEPLHCLDLQALLIFCLIWGMVGALISLALSRIMAKWMMHIELINAQGRWRIEFTWA